MNLALTLGFEPLTPADLRYWPGALTNSARLIRWYMVMAAGHCVATQVCQVAGYAWLRSCACAQPSITFSGCVLPQTL